MKSMPPTPNPHPKDLLLLYVEGLLSAETRTSVMQHLAGCTECSSEVEVLSQTVSLLQRNKNIFCPEPWELAEFAMRGEVCSGNLKRHIEHCPSCAAELEELSRPAPTSPPSELLAAIQKEYGWTTQKEIRLSLARRIGAYAERVATVLRMPLMGIGAVAAVVLVVMLIQTLPPQGRPVVALSPVNWDSSSSGLIPKGSINLMGTARRKPTAAILVYFNSEKDALSPQQIDKLYEQLKPEPDVRTKVKILSPKTIQTKLGLAGIAAMSRNELMRDLQNKCGVSLTALVSLAKVREGYEASIEVIELPSQSVVYKKQRGPFQEAGLGEQLRVSVQDGLEQYEVR